MISKRLRGSLDSSICIRDIFEEGKKMAAIYGMVIRQMWDIRKCADISQII